MERKGIWHKFVDSCKHLTHGQNRHFRVGLDVDRRLYFIFLLVFLGGGLFLSSCSKEKKGEEKHAGTEQHETPAGWTFTLPKGDAAEGRNLFIKMECYKCHEVKGEKFPQVAAREKGVGSELSQMAAMHPPEFFAESIINPNAVIDPDAKERGYVGPDGKSKMPDYSDLLTVKQVADLAAYLVSLKGAGHAGH